MDLYNLGSLATPETPIFGDMGKVLVRTKKSNFLERCHEFYLSIFIQYKVNRTYPFFILTL